MQAGSVRSMHAQWSYSPLPVQSSGAGVGEARPSNAVDTALPPSVHTPQPGTAADDDVPCVIQFSSSMYHVKEGQDREIKVEVMRIGQITGSASIQYATEDGTAKAGKKYVSSSGTVDFHPGQALAHFTVPIIDDPDWGTIVEFKVRLLNPKGGRLGLYLDSARVKIIDDDAFPTNKYRDEVLAGAESIEAIWSLGLFIEFCKLLSNNRNTSWRIAFYMLLDQLNGLYFFMTLYLQVYMIDVVLDDRGGAEERRLSDGLPRYLEERGGEEEESGLSFVYPKLFVPGSRLQTAIVVGFLYFMPILVLHMADLLNCYVLPQAEIRTLLQENLLSKFLNYKEEVATELSVGETSMSMIRDVGEAVDMGFMKLLEVSKIVGKLALATIFLLAENTLAAIPLFVFPIILLSWLALREKVTHKLVHEQAHAQDKVMEALLSSIEQYRLIADFAMRPSMVSVFSSKLKDFHAKERNLRIAVTNNSNIATILTGLLIGSFMVYGSVSVGNGMTLGSFIAAINVFKEVGAEIREVYVGCMEVQRSFAPLKRITDLMNREDDSDARMKVGRSRLVPLKHALGRNTEDTRMLIDDLPIFLKSVTFGFANSPPVLNKVNVEFQQGKLYGFIGPPHEGKSTMLKILGNVILLDEARHGMCYIPSHLRVLHCLLEPALLPGSALANVVLNNALDKVGGKDRVIRICERLQFPDDLLRRVKNEEELDSSRVTYSGHARLGLARALAMNPEVLVVHRPTSLFGDTDMVVIHNLLREHVEHRGLELPPWKQAMRRPRTVFISAQSMQGCACADKVFKVTRDGVQPIPKQPVTVLLGGSDRTADLIS